MSVTHEPLRYAHDEGHTDVCYSEDGDTFITCGADGDIRIWSADEGEDPLHNCVGELAICVRQKGDKVYVATGSNDIQILSLPNGDRDGVLDRFTAPINHIAVGKNKNIIALAGEDMEVKIINLEQENKDVTIFDGLLGPCLSVAISPSSEMVAASCGDCKLRVWDIITKKLLKEITCFPKVNSFDNAKVLCRIDFEPKSGRYLAYPDKNSVVLLSTSDWSEAATLKCDAVSASYSIVQYSPCGKYILASSENGDFVLWETATQNVFKTSSHEKSIAVCGFMWNPKGNGEVVYTDIEGQLGIMSGCIRNEDKSDSAEDNNEFMENDVDFGDVQFEEDEDNENAVSVEQIRRQCMGSPDSEIKDTQEESSHAPTPRPRTPEVPLQTPFMPSSTPDHLDPHYLCWNDVGIIRCYGNNSVEETASKSIEVEFHDATFHNSMMMQNYQDYTLATVSKAVLVVANSSQINVIPLAVSSKEWLLKVEEYEEIVLVAASENLVCFGMGNYHVHVCSAYGTQRAVVSVPGPLVSMAAFKNILMVAYHAGGPRKTDQNISIKIFKFEGMSINSKDIGSALGPESTLAWLGFSDVGTPGMMDSLGILSLYPHNCNTWIPFCDTTKHRKGMGDGFFVTTVFESYQAVGGIKCRGAVYPNFTPRPTMCELPLEPVFVESSTDKAQMEMNLFTWSALEVSDSDKKFKETAVKTFALACKNDLDQRALEFMEILGNTQILNLCLKYATKLNKRRLAEKLMEVASKLNEENEDENLGVAELSTPDPTTFKPAVRKLTLSSSKYNNRNRKLLTGTPEVKQTTQNNVVATPSNMSVNNENSQSQINTPNTQESILTGNESITTEEKPKNPFLKNFNREKVANGPNPLSLTDKAAGITYEEKAKNNETGEKRKLSDSSEPEKQKEKQRKLDKFMFSKRT